MGIEGCEGDQRKLFALVRKLSGDNVDNPLPEHDNPHQLGNSFGEFFYTKDQTIQNKIDNICVSESINQEVPPILTVVLFSVISESLRRLRCAS